MHRVCAVSSTVLVEHPHSAQQQSHTPGTSREAPQNTNTPPSPRKRILPPNATHAHPACCAHPFPSTYPALTLSVPMKLTSLLVLAGLPAGSAFVAPAKVFHGAGVGPAARGGSTERSSSSASCQMMARVPFIAGNWKMNPLDLGTAKDLAKAVSFFAAVVVVFCCLWAGSEREIEGKGLLLPHTRTPCYCCGHMCCDPGASMLRSTEINPATKHM